MHKQYLRKVFLSKENMKNCLFDDKKLLKHFFLNLVEYSFRDLKNKKIK